MSMKRIKDRIFPVYAERDDITFVMIEQYDECTEDVVSLEVVGFYHGEPDPVSTKEFVGKRKATYTW